MTKILIIEDNDGIRENVVEILKLAGYTVFAEDNGKCGVEAAIKNIPDIILCDIMMGDLDGYGVIHMLGKHAQTKAIPFIFITAKSERTDIRKGMDLGADDYLTKPFDDTELLNAIESRLKKNQLQKEFHSKPIDILGQIVSRKSGLDELAGIINERKSRHYKKNQDLYYEGDRVTGIHLVLAGKVKAIKMTDDGRQLMTGLYEEDHFIGVNALFSNETYNDTATVLEESELLFFPKEQFEKLITLYPDVAGKFIKILCNEIVDKEAQLLQLAYQSVRKRIAESILRLYVQHSVKELPINISRDDLAAMSGTAPETVSRTLTDFRAEGLIEKKGSVITILQSEKLEKLKN